MATKSAVTSSGTSLLHPEKSTLPTALAADHPIAEAAKPCAQHILDVLTTQYPALFGDEQRPLKVGIHRDIKARHPGFTTTGIRRAIARIRFTPRYLRALTPGAIRLDLDGNPAGEVTEEQAAQAREHLALLKAKSKAVRANKHAKATLPPATPTPPEPPPSAVSGRPVLRLKKPGAVIAAAVVTRKERKL